jgi:hypothetical protein
MHSVKPHLEVHFLKLSMFTMTLWFGFCIFFSTIRYRSSSDSGCLSSSLELPVFMLNTGKNFRFYHSIAKEGKVFFFFNNRTEVVSYFIHIESLYREVDGWNGFFIRKRVCSVCSMLSHPYNGKVAKKDGPKRRFVGAHRANSRRTIANTSVRST